MSVTLAQHEVSATETTPTACTIAALGAPILSASIRRRAHWETTKRVLAQAVNEGLATGTIETSASSTSLCLRAPDPKAIDGHDGTWIQCGIRADAYVEKDGRRAVGFVRAEDLLNPVLTQSTTGEASEELDPGVLCRIICSWQPELAQPGGGEKLIKEVQNAADNQVKWLEIAATQPRLHLKSPLADWEQSVVTGHPTHPLHKTCFAQPPLSPIMPDDIPGLLSPELSFLSVPRSELRVTGPFEELLKPLLKLLGVPADPEKPGHIIVPCFTRQLPSITPLYPQARRVQSVPECCRAQISVRSISFKPEINFPHHLKLSLFVQITSGLRNVKPWGAVLGPVLGKLLPNLLPPDLWIFEEPASITGLQDDFDDAGKISCVIRKLPEHLAENADEVLIPGAGLYQKPFGEDQTYMEILFGLDGLQKKQAWFRKYAALLFSSLMPPLVQWGLGFESHLQNVLIRVNVTTKEVTGFAIRDFEGTRIHYPTFLRSGYDLSELPKNSPHLSDSHRKPWNKVHHSIIQDNVGPILHILGLEPHGGWSIVREELERVLNPSGDPDGKALWEYFTQEKMTIPRFMGMRLIGRYVESHEVDVPNFVLRK
ncbi:Aerobactin siderophore biosynthesis, IucA/IucC [Beauveria brongniartii RCEF 3172]|uniref:Aerobactin siderophore biosynthesis, IucA/IucC n=1 Tax=Beauveria brongniartii RCEF 3172 TaxID=1081107 RepID=A0A166XDZ4_9HYPO|nr:Aerobactin siderophore biosynthesis, IucA/IucC [Beauveria brongniartii RCEF 3172]